MRNLLKTGDRCLCSPLDPCPCDGAKAEKCPCFAYETRETALNEAVTTGSVVAEVQYGTPVGLTHSDLKPGDRHDLHAALDEWLNRSSGTGFFYIGNLVDLTNNFLEQ